MNRILSGLIVSILLLLAAVLIFPILVDLNDYRGRIENLIEEHTGQHLSIDGNIRLNFYPTLRISVEDVWMKNLPGTSAPNMVTSSSILVEISLLPLLHKEVRLDHITLIEPYVEIEKMASGGFNWEVLLNRLIDARGAEPSESDFRIALHRLTIENAAVIYRNSIDGWLETVELPNTVIEFKDFMTGPYAISGKLVTRNLGLTYQGGLSRVENNNSVKLKLDAHTPAGQSQFHLDAEFFPGSERSLIGSVEWAGKDLADLIEGLLDEAPPSVFTQSYGLRASLKQDGRRIEVEDLDLALGDTHAKGSLGIHLSEAISMGARLKVHRIELDQLIANTPDSIDPTIQGHGASRAFKGFRLPHGLSARFDIGIDSMLYKGKSMRRTVLKASLEKGQVAVEKFATQLPGGAALSITGHMNAAQENPQFLGSVHLAAKDLHGLLDWLDLSLPNTPQNTFQDLVLNSEMRASRRLMELNGLDLSFDRSKLLGDIKMAIGERRLVKADLVLDRLTVNHYIPQNTTVVNPPDTASENPFKMLKNVIDIDADIVVQIGKINYYDRHLKSVTLSTALQKNDLTIRVNDSSEIKSWFRMNLKKIADKGIVVAGFSLTAQEPTRLVKLWKSEYGYSSQRLGALHLKGEAVGSLKALHVNANFCIQGASLRVQGVVSNSLSQSGYDLGYELRIENTKVLKQLIKLSPAVSLRKLEPMILQGRVSGDLSTMKIYSETVIADTQATIKGTLKIREAEIAEGSLRLLADDPRGLLRLGGMALPSSPGKLDVLITAKGNAERVELGALVLLNKVRLKLDGKALKLYSNPSIALHVNGTHPDLYWLLRSVYADYRPFGGSRLGDVDLQGTVQASPAGVTIPWFKAKVGPVDLAGRIAVRGIEKGYRLSADIDSQQLDLRSLVHIEQGNEKNKVDVVEHKEKLFPDTPLSLDILRDHNAELMLRARRILIPGMALQDVDLYAELKQGRFRIQPLQAVVGGGSLHAEFDMRSHSAQSAAIKTVLRIEQMNLGHVLKELNVAHLLEGKLDAKFELNSVGGSLAELMGNLNGSTDIIVGKGRVGRGFINRYIALLATDLISSLRSLLRPFDDKTEYNHFNCYVDHMKIASGYATTTARVFDSDRMSIVGYGGIDLNKEELEMVLASSPKQGVGLKGIGRLSLSLGELAKPVKISGKLYHPSVGIVPDEKALIQGYGGTLLFGPYGMIAALVKYRPDQGNICLAAVEAAKKGVPIEMKEEEGIIYGATQIIRLPVKLIKGVGKTLGSGLEQLLGEYD